MSSNSERRSILYLLRTVATLGQGAQTFIGARWIVAGLRLCPTPWQRAAALRILGLSPHYFYRHNYPEHPRLSQREFLEAEARRNRESRQKILDRILSPHLRPDDVVLDYGCGPGFLARAVAPVVKRLYAFDISAGAVECARIINPAPNLSYLSTADELQAEVPDGSIDAVYSIAVIQHVHEEALASIASTCARTLKPGGRLIWQVQLEGPGWRSESEWRADASLQGKLKMKYGLHCFARTREFFVTELSRHGFLNIEVEPIAGVVEDRFDDICDQHLLTAIRA